MADDGTRVRQCATTVQERGSVSRVDVSHASRCSSYGFGGRLIDYPPVNVIYICMVAIGVAWPTSTETIIHGKLIVIGCVKVQVDEIVQWPRYALKIVNKETPSRGSPSNAFSDTSPTSCYHPQDYMMHHEDQHVEVVNSFP
ncbi:hypothetical protein QVD17_37729 [Tagetes erecta]|uniref:Uncharacterized protein n=1 Tax=Tagetes erecta TaxID=13708 RepID=A0AAD8NK99_TARER|nr:hypothetical protein QVD17_37729 [Tagetes erecta]